MLVIVVEFRIKPPFVEAFERAIVSSRPGLNAQPLPKIFSSGRKRTLVPRRFMMLPSFSSLVCGSPLLNTMR